MKILIRSLSLTITVLIHCREINSSSGSQGFSQPNWHMHGLASPQAPQTDVKIVQITFKGMTIEVAGVTHFGHFKTLRCTLIGRNSQIPDLEYRKTHNYITRSVTKDDMRCVAYVLGDGSVLGVKAPPIAPPPRGAKGYPCYLNPDATKWYLTYMNHDYEIRMFPDSGLVYDVLLFPEDKRRASKYLQKNVGSYPVHFGSLHFTVFQRVKGEIVGAQLQLPKITEGNAEA